MPVIVTFAASLFASIAAWLSFGAIGFRRPSGARIGVLPLEPVPLACALAAGVVAFVLMRRRGRSAAFAVAPLALVVVPWLPIPLPPAFLIWTGALTVPIWLAAAIALMLAPSESESPAPANERLAARAPAAADAGRPSGPAYATVVGAFVAGCVVFGGAAWCASPSVPGGDEPHYLVITQSLLHDHDLNVENNYAQGDYREYYGGPLTPDFRIRGRHGELYSIHAPGVPALVLPAFAIGGYHGVVVFLVLLSSAACALAWWLAWRATNSVTAAWFGWAVVACGAPFLLESFTVYPDGPGAAAVLTAFWALQRLDGGERPGARVWILHGAALAALPWMHTRFVLLAGVLGVLIVVRLARSHPLASVAAFLTVPILSAAAWLAAAYAMYGTANPAAAYGGESDTALAFLPNGLGGLLFDQGFGLIATAPALAIAFAGLTRVRRFAVEWGVTAIVYGAAVGAYAMWWAGSSGPSRFLIPTILPLAIPAACAWNAWTSRGARAVMLLLLVFSAWLAFVMAAGGGGMLGYHGRNVYSLTAAPWLAWANSVVDLSQALPAFVPLPQGTALGGRVTAARAGFAAIVPWGVCLALAVIAAVRLGRSRDTAWSAIVAATTGAFAIAVMIAASIVWRMHDARPLTTTTAQFDLLRRLADGRTLALDLSRAQRIRNFSELNMRIVIPVEPDPSSPATLASIPALPAGNYGVTYHGSLRAPASAYAGQDDEPFALQHGVSVDRLDFDLPVPVRALTIRAPSSAGVGAIEMKPYAPGIYGVRMKDPVFRRLARHAATYGHVGVFFLDDRTSPEEDGFWIWGARDGLVMFRPNGTLGVTLRNGPVVNEVTVRALEGEQRLTLQPGEERPVSLPTVYMGGAYPVSIRTSTGFRPSDVDPKSHDRRFLGVYVVMPEHASR
jgi:hypothetical protein